MHSRSIRNGTGNRRQTRIPDKAWRWILSITPERLPYNPRFCEEYTLFRPGKPPHRYRSEGCTFRMNHTGLHAWQEDRACSAAPGSHFRARGGCPRENGTFALVKFCHMPVHRNRYPARMNTDYADVP